MYLHTFYKYSAFLYFPGALNQISLSETLLPYNTSKYFFLLPPPYIYFPHHIKDNVFQSMFSPLTTLQDSSTIKHFQKGKDIWSYHTLHYLYCISIWWFITFNNYLVLLKLKKQAYICI